MEKHMAKSKESPAAISNANLRSFENVVWRDPNSLIEYALNNRDHPAEQISKLAGQIKMFGFNVPIVVDEDNVIISGHGRKLASLQLGLKEVPVIVRDNLSETEKKKARLGDNQIATLSTINLENVNLELAELKDLGIDLDSLGFSKADLDKLTADLESVNANLEGSKAEEKAPRCNIHYNINFEDETQEQAWFRFLKYLSKTYPAHDTVGQRLADFIEEAGF